MTSSQNKKGVFRGVLLEQKEYEQARSMCLKVKNDWVREHAWLETSSQGKSRISLKPIPSDFEPTPSQLKRWRKAYTRKQKKSANFDQLLMRGSGFNSKLDMQIAQNEKLLNEHFDDGLATDHEWVVRTQNVLADLKEIKAARSQQK
tara:strand:- start:195 stop:635 length:441 start_codon:yes stop_codon:yes gene_type:complete